VRKARNLPRHRKYVGRDFGNNRPICHPEVTDYVVDHPAEEITWKNLFNMEK
jgi:hypothetical protein